MKMESGWFTQDVPPVIIEAVKAAFSKLQNSRQARSTDVDAHDGQTGLQQQAVGSPPLTSEDARLRKEVRTLRALLDQHSTQALSSRLLHTAQSSPGQAADVRLVPQTGVLLAKAAIERSSGSPVQSPSADREHQEKITELTERCNFLQRQLQRAHNTVSEENAKATKHIAKLKTQIEQWERHAKIQQAKIAKWQSRYKALKEKDAAATRNQDGSTMDTDNISEAKDLQKVHSPPPLDRLEILPFEVADCEKAAPAAPAASTGQGHSTTNFVEGSAIHNVSQDPSSDQYQMKLQSDSTASTDEHGSDYDLPSLSVRRSPGVSLSSIKREPSSEGPVVVTERPVKRRKAAKGPSDTITLNHAIKHEDHSGLISITDWAQVNPEESQDLDQIQPGLSTPRKHRLLLHQHANQQHARFDPRRQPKTSKAAEPQPAASVSGSAIIEVDHHRAPLRQVSSNVQSSMAQNPKSKAGVRTIVSTTEESTHVSETTPEAAGDEQPRVLLDILNGRATPAINPNKRLMPRPESLQRNRTKSPSAARVRPLRERPIEELRLSDFKVNPARNNGLDYAVTEVVRDRAGRASLEACVDPQCCGKDWRAMAESELHQLGPSILGTVENIALMEDYLGDQCHHLGRMTPEEKKELWLKAQTKELADKFGKHRHRFHRAPTPPGFWNADFPTTQQAEAERAAAMEAERRVVEERNREARQKHGRWLFRDE